MEELSLHEVADELGVHYMTAYRYVRLGMLPARREGRQWRVSRSDLDAYRAGPAVEKSTGAAHWDERLLHRLIAGDEPGAWGVIQAALAAGSTPQTVLTEMMTPALRKVGRLWAGGDIGVEQEHTASSIAVRLVGRLGAAFARRGMSKGTVVLGTTADELHGLPLTIAADFIRLAGFDVVDLGPRLPPEAFARAAATANRLVAVGVGVTTSGQEEAIKTTIDTLRSAVDVPLIIGGSAVGSREQAQALGGDDWAATAAEFVELLAALAA